MRCVQPDPALRYQRTQELLIDLEAVTGGGTVAGATTAADTDDASAAAFGDGDDLAAEYSRAGEPAEIGLPPARSFSWSAQAEWSYIGRLCPCGPHRVAGWRHRLPNPCPWGSFLPERLRRQLARFLGSSIAETLGTSIGRISRLEDDSCRTRCLRCSRTCASRPIRPSTLRPHATRAAEWRRHRAVGSVSSVRQRDPNRRHPAGCQAPAHDSTQGSGRQRQRSAAVDGAPQCVRARQSGAFRHCSKAARCDCVQAVDGERRCASVFQRRRRTEQTGQVSRCYQEFLC